MFSKGAGVVVVVVVVVLVGEGDSFFLLIVINRFLITRFIFPSSHIKHPLRRQLLLKDLFFFNFST